MAFNLNSYATDNSRDDNFRSVFNGISPDPDILIGVELNSEVWANAFLDNVLNFSGSTIYSMGTFLLNNDDPTDNNVIYYKKSKFTLLRSDLVIPSASSNTHPTYKFQLYHNLTGDKIIIYGVHFTSGGSQHKIDQRDLEAHIIRNETITFTSSEFFIAAGDFNGNDSLWEASYSTLIDQTTSGYFIDPKNGSESEDLWTKDIQGAFNRRYDLILNSQSVVNAGGVHYEPISYTVAGNDGSGLKSNIPQAYKVASNHLPVYADYTFDFPTPKNPPYPGSIVFTQVGATDPDVIEFMTLYRMDLTTLKITDNPVNADSSLGTGEGEFDLSNTSWTDVPAGTFVRLGTGLTNDNTVNASDRFLQYNGTPGSAPYPSLDIGGEQLIAYTGPSSNPTYIAGINWGNSGWLGATSYAPGTPSDISLGTGDNYYFSGTVDDILNVTRDTLTNQLSWSSFAGGSYNDLTLTIGNSALPVELVFFTANLNGNSVELRWLTETEVNNYGFNIERKAPLSPPVGGNKGEWVTVGFVEGHGNSNSPKHYNFVDNDILSGTYYYRLKQIDNDGSFEYSDVMAVEAAVPNRFYLSQNYPNPFNPSTRIDFTLPQKQFVSLRIYNMLGELIDELINEEKEAGRYSVIFDASHLPSGVYIYRLQFPSFAENKKMTFLK